MKNVRTYYTVIQEAYTYASNITYRLLSSHIKFLCILLRFSSYMEYLTI